MLCRVELTWGVLHEFVCKSVDVFESGGNPARFENEEASRYQGTGRGDETTKADLEKMDKRTLLLEAAGFEVCPLVQQKYLYDEQGMDKAAFIDVIVAKIATFRAGADCMVAMVLL